MNNPLKPFRPLLAATIENDEQLQSLDWPMIISPKVDGIRVLCHPTLGPVTRSLKPVPNLFIRNALSRPEFNGFDGEVTVGEAFQHTASGVMTHDGEPDFHYHVFDNFQLDAAYEVRVHNVQQRVMTECKLFQPFLKVLAFHHIPHPEQLFYIEQEWLAQGFEGVMLRHRNGRYKHGRSTLKEQILLKLKRFQDADATIVGFEPLYHNTNPQTRDNLGLAERSDHKVGKVQDETLGSLLVRHEGGFGDFAIGSGFDQSLRSEIWNNRPRYLGKQVTFKYQPTGIKEKPRFPIFLRFRPQE